MSNNIFFSENYAQENNQIITKLVITGDLENADYVVVNDTTTIRDELKEAQVSYKTFKLIDSVGIFNLSSEDKETLHDIDPIFVRQMEAYLENENTDNIKKINKEDKKKVENNISFTCVNCACYPVCKFVDKVEEALAELSKIGIKLTSCDYFVKY